MSQAKTQAAMSTLAAHSGTLRTALGPVRARSRCTPLSSRPCSLLGHTASTSPIESSPVVPVDLVTIGEKTNIAPMVKQERASSRPSPTKCRPPPQPTPAPPQPDRTRAHLPLAKAVPVPKPQPAPKTRSIRHQQHRRAPEQTAKPRPLRRLERKDGPQTIKGIGAQNAMTADLKTLLQSEIYRCWSPPVGAPDAKDMVVSIRFVPQSGRIGLAAATIDCKLSRVCGRQCLYAGSGRSGAARDLHCAPYRLPADRYGQWRERYIYVRSARYDGTIVLETWHEKNRIGDCCG